MTNGWFGMEYSYNGYFYEIGRQKKELAHYLNKERDIEISFPEILDLVRLLRSKSREVSIEWIGSERKSEEAALADVKKRNQAVISFSVRSKSEEDLIFHTVPLKLRKIKPKNFFIPISSDCDCQDKSKRKLGKWGKVLCNHELASVEFANKILNNGRFFNPDEKSLEHFNYKIDGNNLLTYYAEISATLNLYKHMPGDVLYGLSGLCKQIGMVTGGIIKRPVYSSDLA